MKLKLLIFVSCMGMCCALRSQTPLKIKGSVFAVSSINFKYPAKALFVTVLPFIPLKKELTLKYQPAKLPIFCRMENAFRDKFKVFLKLRAGNDESYMKMIGSAGH